MGKLTKAISVLLLLTLTTCEIGSRQQKRVDYFSESYEVGPVVFDTLFHGKVNRYDLKGNFLGFANYRYGKLDGAFVSKFRNGYTEDSLHFKNGLKEGIWYKFDSLGRKKYETYFLMDRPVGNTLFFDSLGNLSKYTFTSFEGDVKFSTLYRKNDTLEYGNLPVYHYDSLIVGGISKKVRLFLYLITVPNLKMHYEIAVVRDGKIIKSERISESGPFYESYMDLLPSGSNYAIVVSMFNFVQGKNNVSVYVLE